jgi:hypothetical protein
MDGQTDRRWTKTDRWPDRHKNRRTYIKQTEGWTDREMSGKTDIKTDRGMDRQIDGR